jgi:hypothetical protein
MTGEHKLSPEHILALQEASAARALQVLTEAIKDGTVVRNTDGKKERLTTSHTRQAALSDILTGCRFRQRT